MRILSWKTATIVVGAVGLGWAIGNVSLTYSGPNEVSTGFAAGQWEPSTVSPTAPGSTWVHSWYSYGNSAAYTAAWNPTTSQWVPSGPIKEPSGNPIGDVFTAYDAVHNQYLLATGQLENTNSSVYFATSSDGRTWPALQPIMSSPNGAFDYSSVAVDSNGRIIVGAVLYQNTQNTSQTWGYDVIIGTYSGGQLQWSGINPVVVPPGPQVQSGTADTARWGINGRVVAAGSRFYIFLPALLQGYQFAPLAVYNYVENGGGSWSGPYLIRDFSGNPPDNNSQYFSQLPGYLYYAPLIDASGNASGTWAVTFQAKTDGINSLPYNNTWVCASTRGCGLANEYAGGPEFSNGVSVDTLGGTWISHIFFLDYPTNLSALYHQTIYFPPPGTNCGNGTACGANGATNVNPTSWAAPSVPPGAQPDRCQDASTNCLGIGDYARVGTNGGSPSNNSLWLDAPYVNFDPNHQGELFQLFYIDPQGPAPPNTFTVNPVFYPLGGEDLAIGKPRPSYALGVPPERRRKMPGFNH